MGFDEWCAFEYEDSKMLTFEEIERQKIVDEEDKSKEVTVMK